ncbi:MAG: hypothetical protein JNL10_11425 [Verrucomicrobiales bacterium]|nr:hypothetical protein [Verrucomicrobiales bacterium]
MRNLAEHLRSGRRFNTLSFSSDWEVSPKTIRRDIEFMRDRLGYVIEFDFAANSYRLLDAPKPSL